MGATSSIDLLNRTHQFPGPFVFKVIGRSDNGFAARVVAAVRQELAGEIDPPHSMREAVGGRHVAVTLVPDIKSAEQVLAVYRRVRKIAGLVMML